MSETNLIIEKMYSGAMYDALRKVGLRDYEFLLSKDIRPLNENDTIYGPIFTMKGEVVGPTNYENVDQIRLEIYPRILSNMVVVLSTNDRSVAHCGDIGMQLINHRRARGFLTDGLVRDSKRIREIGTPCFCAGTCPIDAIDYWAITKFQCDISLRAYEGGMISVSNGDWVFADCDGAMIIPKKHRTLVEESYVEVAANEAYISDKISQGVSARTLYDQMGRW